jgi:hypothetical protein
MILNNAIRQAFIRTVLNDVPQVDYDEQIRILVQKAAVNMLDPKVRAVWDDAALRSHVVTAKLEPIEHEWNFRISIPWYADYVGREKFEKDLPPNDLAELKDLIRLREEQAKIRVELRDKLTGVVSGCRTRKQLAAQLPEFEKYLPEAAEKVSNLPALANLMADFVKAGWPKDQEPAKLQVLPVRNTLQVAS